MKILIPLGTSPTGEARYVATIDPEYAVGASMATLTVEHDYGGTSHLTSLTVRGVTDPYECAVRVSEQMARIAAHHSTLAHTLRQAAYRLQGDPTPTHRRNVARRLPLI